MKFFSKKQDDELFSLIEKNMKSAVNNFEDNSIGKSNSNTNKNQELIVDKTDNDTISDSTIALELLKKRMREASLQNPLTEIVSEESHDAEKNSSDADSPSSYSLSDDIIMTHDVKFPGSSRNFTSKEANQGFNILKNHGDSEKNKPATSFDIKSNKNPVFADKGLNKEINAETSLNIPVSTKHAEDFARTKSRHKKTLLEKCKPFIVDDNGKDDVSSSAPIYKLESVADILNSESQKTLDKLSQKYEISFDDLGKYHNSKPETAINSKSVQVVEKQTPSQSPVEREVFEEKIPANMTLKNFQTSISHIISDIDTTLEEKPVKEPKMNFDDTATIKFTPVSDNDGSSSRISISSQTRPIDLTSELTQLSNEKPDDIEEEIRLEQNDFEEYVPDDEFNSEDDSKRFLRTFSIKKRNSFLITAVSLIACLLLGFMKLPFMTSVILAHTKLSMIISTAILGIIILSNIRMFKSLTKIFSSRSNADVTASLSSLTVLAYCIYGIFKNEITLDLTILLAFILFVRALSQFFKDSHMLSNFKQISSASPKRAIKLIGDPAITFAMAKNAVEGDTLIAAPQRAAHIGDFMKYSTYGTFFAGKLPSVTILSIILSLITGLACTSYFDGLIYGFYSAAAMQCFAALPIIFLIDNLPLYSASKKLNKVGAIIAGKTGAEHIEMANAVVFSSEDLFPSGTVTLHNMKILAENSVDDTIIRAASLTDSLGSTLSPIFKKIAGTGSISSLPDSDTVKYEDRMGISGWVDNKLLFIGNRTLMEAHGIDIPDVEVDRKILRKGFFPVYVASGDKACALLVIQYTVRPEIAREMQKISSLGVTMLINNSDPNLTEEMVCDYMGLYDDSVKIMSSAGCHMYKNTVTKAKRVSAPAAYKGNPIGLASIINCATKIKKSNVILSVFYILAAVIGAILFAYSSFDGSGTLTSSVTILVYGIVCTAISYILYLMEKP